MIWIGEPHTLMNEHTQTSSITAELSSERNALHTGMNWKPNFWCKFACYFVHYVSMPNIKMHRVQCEAHNFTAIFPPILSLASSFSLSLWPANVQCVSNRVEVKWWAAAYNCIHRMCSTKRIKSHLNTQIKWSNDSHPIQFMFVCAFIFPYTHTHTRTESKQ